MAFRSIVALHLVFFALDALALSCGIASEQELVDNNDHIFFALVTEAKFVPSANPSRHRGTIVAQFDVGEVLKGDPTRVPHIVADVSEPEAWPAEIHLGRKYLIFANEGPARFGACSGLFRDIGRENWCLEYQVRKRVGYPIAENRICEVNHIRRAMARVGFEHKSERNDLDGLRLEWIARFGKLPE